MSGWLSEQTAEEQAQRRAEQERLRIARDLHDVVAHTITTINVQAGVAVRLLHRDPEHARNALATIESASHEALDELRTILGVMRDTGGGRAPLDPPPGLDTVRDLVARSCDSGSEVELDVDGEPPGKVPDAVQLAAFRIVQESLTNARRHAPGAPVRVALAYRDDRMCITVDNATGPVLADAPSLPGVGILGMRERAAVIGGTVTAAATPNGFRVRAELPYRRGA